MDAEPVLEFATDAEWAAWLEEQHATASGVWLKIAKKNSGVRTVTPAEALDTALCYGWIDGLRRRFDERYMLQRYTPRRRGSTWSRINRDKATALIEAGRMRPAGLAEVERARADGRWEAAYPGSRTATVPPDLQAALDADPQAAAFFAELDSRNRYAVLYRVMDAKRPETRARRIKEFVTMLAEGRRLHP
nr:YdeI/OmpD-associated family protein [Streptomyces sp. YIM 98790]